MTEFETGIWILADDAGRVVDLNEQARTRFADPHGHTCRDLVQATTADGAPHCHDNCFANLPREVIRSRVVYVCGERVRLTCARDQNGHTIHIDAD